MTDEFKTLTADLDSAFFRYAHITGALELYMMVLENPILQKSISSVTSGSEIEWKVIHRFMVIDGKSVKWYPELPVQEILNQRNAISGYLYGITLSKMIGDLDYYLSSILQNHFGHIEVSGNSWKQFIQKTNIDLLNRKHAQFIFTILQERHKIEHNKAQIDRVFLDRMAKQNIQHAYKDGDPIQKSHIDVLLTHQALREFSEDVDTELSKIIKK
jgi:hypothetical protein